MVAEALPSYSSRSKRSVQLVAGLGSSIAPFLVASMFVAAPTIGEDLGGEVALLAWLTAAFFLVAASLLIPFGRVADVRGSKKVFTAGMAVYVVSGLLCLLSPDLLLLIIGRALTGAGAAMVFGTSIALLSLVFPEQERGKAIGVNVTAMFGGFTAGLLAGGFLTFYFSWRALFAIAVVLAALNIFLLRARVKGECELARERGLDPVGMALFSTSLLLVFFGLSEVMRPLGQLGLVAGVVAIVALMFWERRSRHPIIGRRVAGNRPFIVAVVTNILFQAGSFAVPLLLSLYSQLSLGLDPREASFILIIPQVLMTVLSSVSGRLLPRMGSRPITTAGAIINAAGLSVLILYPGEPSVLGMVASLALLGIGTGLFMPALVDWAMGTMVRKEYGVGSAVIETARLLGMTLSNVALILILVAVPAGGTGDLSSAVQVTAAAFIILTASVLPLTLRAPRSGRGPRLPQDG